MEFFNTKEDCLEYVFDELIASIEEDFHLQNWQAGESHENSNQSTRDDLQAKISDIKELRETARPSACNVQVTINSLGRVDTDKWLLQHKDTIKSIVQEGYNQQGDSKGSYHTEAWRLEVANGVTLLGYLAWMKSQ